MMGKQATDMDEKQIQRIIEMEAALDESANAVRVLSEALDRYEAAAGCYNELVDYYESGDWRADFEADEAGLIPADIKRGVLSEDAVYDLITENEGLMKRLCDPDGCTATALKEMIKVFGSEGIETELIHVGK